MRNDFISQIKSDTSAVVQALPLNSLLHTIRKRILQKQTFGSILNLNYTNSKNTTSTESPCLGPNFKMRV